MARVPYDTGETAEPFPTIAPRTSTPDDTLRVRATPDEFGGQIAQGTQKLGEGAFSAAQHFEQVQTDDAATSAMKQADDVMNEFRTLRGADALNAQEDYKKRVDDIFSEGRKGLSTPDQQFRYDQTVRNFQLRYINGTFASHADEAAKFYASHTNSQAADLHLGLIAQNPNDETVFRDNVEEVRRARVQQTQVEGLGPQAATQAVRGADAEAWSARIRAIAAAGNPSAALDLANRNREALSVVDSHTGATFYDTLVANLQAKADQQIGTNVGREEYARATAAHPYANGAMPVYSNVVQANPNGFSQRGLTRTVQIESGGNPEARNGDAVGLGQFKPATWREYGQGSPTDPDQAIFAIQRYASANKPALARALGREPTDAELYLAHQQGLVGAIRLLTNPSAAAGSLVGADAVRLNGGDPNAPAYEFTGMWARKFNGSDMAQPAALPANEQASPRSRRADAMAGVIGRMDQLSPGAYAHASQTVLQLASQDQIASAADERARKLNSDKAADGYVTQMWQMIQSGQPQWGPLTQKIVNDQTLEWNVKNALMERVKHLSGEEEALAFGPGYYSARQALFSDPDAPGHASDLTPFINRPDITTAGLRDLSQRLSLARQSVDRGSIERRANSILQGAKADLSFQDDTGPVKIRDAKGEAIFHYQFVPDFLKRLSELEDQADKTGNRKPLDEFLDGKNVRTMVRSYRSKASMDMDRIAAMGGLGDDQHDAAIPSAPAGIEPAAWTRLMTTRPILRNGQSLPPQNWAEALTYLRAHPDEKTVGYFNKHFAGYDGHEVLKQLGEGPAKPAQKPEQKEPETAKPKGDFRPGSPLDLLFNPNPPAVAKPQAAVGDPNLRRRELEAEQAREGAAVVSGAP